MLKAEIEGRSYSPPPPSAVPPPQRGGGGGGGAGSRSPASSGSRNPSAGKNLDDWGNWDGDKVRWGTWNGDKDFRLLIDCLQHHFHIMYRYDISHRRDIHASLPLYAGRWQ